MEEAGQVVCLYEKYNDKQLILQLFDIAEKLSNEEAKWQVLASLRDAGMIVASELMKKHQQF